VYACATIAEEITSEISAIHAYTQGSAELGVAERSVLTFKLRVYE